MKIPPSSDSDDDHWVVTYKPNQSSSSHTAARPNEPPMKISPTLNVPSQFQLPGEQARADTTTRPQRSQRLHEKRCGKWPNGIT